MNKGVFLSDLRSRIETRQHQVLEGFRPLSPDELGRRPAAGEWSILECFDHLNQTHAYYAPKIETALRDPARVQPRVGGGSGAEAGADETYGPGADVLVETPQAGAAQTGAAQADTPQADADRYAPSFWGRIYMAFAFNPRLSFPTAAVLQPGAALDAAVLERFLENQQQLLRRLEALAEVDLRATRVPISGMVRFNLGDCLKILVYHDELHANQAFGVRRAVAGF